MLNQVSLMGRLVADPDIRKFNKNGKENTLAQYRLAIERDYKDKKDNLRPVDFIACKAFGGEAQYAEAYFHRGDTVVITGRLTTELYTKEGEARASIFTYILIKDNYLAKRRGDEQARSRVMDPVEDGKPLNVNNDLPEDYYQNLPPLPDEELFEQIPVEPEVVSRMV